MFGFKKKRIYLDHASAPPILRDAVRAMRAAEHLYGNPGAIHSEGVAAKRSLEDSRARIAALLGCKAREVVFTSGLTESNNLAVIGYAKHLERLKGGLAGTHWLVSAIEHDSILSSFAEIEAMGGTVSYVEPDARGIILPQAVAGALRPETVFVSVGWANNEIGVIQPLAKIAQTLRAHEKKHASRIIFHSDAGQAPLYISTIVHSLGVDLLSLGANKLYGPHGIGALYIGKDISLAPTTAGGKQERNLRAGTESVALAAGFARAFEIVAGEREEESKRIESLRCKLAEEIVARVPGVIVNGDLKCTLPHMLNISIPNIQSEYVTLMLDHAGIAISTKSACREGEESRSHVVACLAEAAAKVDGEGGEAWRAKNTLRFSLGRETADGDIQHVATALSNVLDSRGARI